MHNKGWNSIASRIYYSFGAAYYLYKWGLIAGIGGLAGGLIVQYILPNIGVFIITPSVLILLISICSELKKRRIELHSLNPALEIVKEESIYEQHNKSSYTYIKKLTIKSHQNGINVFRTKYKWSGAGEVNISTPINRHEIKIDDTKGIPWEICEVYFTSPLKRGQIENVEIHMRMNSSIKPPLPFLARFIDEPYTDGIELCVIFPASIQVNTVVKEIYISQRALTPIFTETVSFDSGSRRICWKIPRPRLGCRYNLKWY